MADRTAIFLDIDGTILKHHNGGLSAIASNPPELLPGTLEMLDEWESKGYKVILTTNRPEGMRDLTIHQLHSIGVYNYSVLLMEVPPNRVVINDIKDGVLRAKAVNLSRNKGISKISV